MTLVIAKRYKNGQVSLSSDSRISFGSSGNIDYGIKIFRVPVRIFSPTRQETGVEVLDYNHTIGLAIAGSAVNAYTVKEAVIEMLQHLQYAPGYTDVSFAGIAKLVFKVYEKTCKDLGRIMGDIGFAKMVLTGFCPATLAVRSFAFTRDFEAQMYVYRYEEILKEPGIEFFGSGERFAKDIYDENPDLSPLHIIRQVIREGRDSKVGGGLQAGHFEGYDFKVFGVTDYTVDDRGYFAEYTYTLRGINMFKDEFERDNEDFHVSYTYLQPFDREINDLLDRRIEDLDRGIN